MNRSPIWPLLLATALTTTGCGVLMTREVDQVRDPLTPEQAKSQAVEAAREIVSILGVRAKEAWVSLESCNDQGEAPFRGSAAVHYPKTANIDAHQADVTTFLQRLNDAGWTHSSDNHSGMPNVTKDGVTLYIQVQSSTAAARVLTVLGQCRDITTTKATRGKSEPFIANP
jgi:hypothetical protein